MTSFIFGRSRSADCCRCYVAVPDGEAEARRPSISIGRAVLLAVSSALVAAVATAAVLGAKMPDKGSSPEAQAALPMCSEPAQELTPSVEMLDRAGRAAYVLGELTTEETRAVAAFAAKELGCSTRFVDNPHGCFLTGAEAVVLQQPAKDAVLAHIDNGSPPPPRFAQVTVAHGDKPIAEGVGIYQVGPLDGKGGLVDGASVSLMHSVHYNYRPLDVGDSSCDVVLHKVVAQLEDLLVASFGDSIRTLKGDAPGPDGGYLVYYAVAVTSTLHRRVSRTLLGWLSDPTRDQVAWLHQVPFVVYIVQEGPLAAWYAENVTYCGQVFRTTEDLVEANRAGTLKKCTYKPHTEYTWDSAGPDEGTPAASEVPTPGRTIRKTWQVVNNTIHWRDWDLFAAVRPGTGLTLYDVRYRGDRILYELSQQEAQAYYSGATSGYSQFHYSDKAYSLTGSSQNMLPGLDCPEGASYLTATKWLSFSPKQKPIADPSQSTVVSLACIFESDGYEASMWRHGMVLSDKVSGRLSQQLIVRSVTTVGNYDYIAEVRLGEDGAVQVRNDFAGYPETDHVAPYMEMPVDGRRTEKQGDHEHTGWVDWGTRVRGDLVLQFHSHFVSWKVDLDVLGQRNEFHISRSSFKAEDGIAMKVQLDERIDVEDPSSLLIATASAPKLWRVVNAERPNALTGVPRGYAIAIDSAPAVQVLPADHPFSVTGTFAKRHLAVAQRKDTEPSSASVLDHFALNAPLLSVDKFLEDQESLVGVDLVCWVNIGKEHFTRSEDVPLISNMGVQFSLLPWNYHEQNPTMNLPMMRSWRP